MESSISRKYRKNPVNSCLPWVKSWTPMTSRQECIESCGMPASTVRMPVKALIVGPMVLPHGQSLRTTQAIAIAYWKRDGDKRSKCCQHFFLKQGENEFATHWTKVHYNIGYHPIQSARTNEFLHGNLTFLSEFAQNESGQRVGGVSLIGIGFNDDPAIERRWMLRFVFGCIIGMHGMSLIDGQTKRSFE